MKLLLLTTLLATICYVNAGAGKRQRMMAAMNGMNGMNGGMNGVNPGLMPGGLNPPMVAGAGAGFAGQPQFAQFVPAFAAPPPIPNIYPVPAVNAVPYMGVPQMAAMNPLQQPLMALAGGPLQQQLPLQPDPLRRFRRQIMSQDNTPTTTVATQIPAPTGATTVAPCSSEDHHEDK